MNGGWTLPPVDGNMREGDAAGADEKAGWFGDGKNNDYVYSVWSCNPTIGFKGKMMTVSSVLSSLMFL